MESILTSLSTSISEFKANPSAAVKRAEKRPFAVLVNNKPNFYVVDPELYKVIAEILFDMEMAPTLKKRIARIATAIPVNIDDL